MRETSRPGQRVEHGRGLRLARAILQMEAIIRILFSAQNGMHLAQRQQRAAPLAERVVRVTLPSVSTTKRRPPPWLAACTKPLMKRIRGVAAHPFPQRGGKVPGLRGMGADRVGKQRVAD